MNDDQDEKLNNHILWDFVLLAVFLTVILTLKGLAYYLSIR